MKNIIGIDIGGVIMDKANSYTATSFFGENYLQATACPHAFEYIHMLYQNCFAGNVSLVSKCRPEHRPRMLLWLEHQNFYNQTGLKKADIFFCTKVSEKRTICQKLKVTHFIDDRLEVLLHLIGVVPYLYLFSPRDEDVKKFGQYLSAVTVVHDWQECYQAIMTTM